MGLGEREKHPLGAALLAAQGADTTAAPPSAASTVASMAAASTGCGLTSTNSRWPLVSSARVAVSSRTVSRRLRAQ
ncbi:hypothetical protein SANTM175S_08608 [Streptomyces antimycoticus]